MILKIAYYLELNPSRHLGVYNKVMSQVSEWLKCHDVRVFMISHCPEGAVKLDDYVKIYSSFLVKYWDNPLARYLNRMLCFQMCKRDLYDFNPDVIYYRQNVYYPGLSELFGIAKTVVEVNHPIKINEGNYPAYVEKISSFFDERILKKASGFVCTSTHIKISLENEGLGAEKLVLSNGVSFLDVIPARDKTYNKPRLIMVGTPGQPWQGYDKFIRMAEFLPEFNFFLVGPQMDEESTVIPENFYSLGFKTQEELFSMYKNIDVGVGTLAAYRKGIGEASPLKTREYAKYGLPMIIGYHDTDLPDDHEKICNIGNHPDNVDENLELIADFVRKFHNKEKSMRGYEVLSSKSKEKNRLALFSKLTR